MANRKKVRDKEARAKAKELRRINELIARKNVERAARVAEAEAAGVAAAEAAGGRREQFSAPKLPHGEARFALRTSGRSTRFVHTKVRTLRLLRTGLVDIGRLGGLKSSEKRRYRHGAQRAVLGTKTPSRRGKVCSEDIRAPHTLRTHQGEDTKAAMRGFSRHWATRRPEIL